VQSQTSRKSDIKKVKIVTKVVLKRLKNHLKVKRRGGGGVGVWEKSDSNNYIPFGDVVKKVFLLAKVFKIAIFSSIFRLFHLKGFVDLTCIFSVRIVLQFS
jgi:hypothetical protein